MSLATFEKSENLGPTIFTNSRFRVELVEIWEKVQKSYFLKNSKNSEVLRGYSIHILPKHINVYICVHVYIHICICVHVHICIYAYMHTYVIYTYSV